MKGVIILQYMRRFKIDVYVETHYGSDKEYEIEFLLPVDTTEEDAHNYAFDTYVRPRMNDHDGARMKITENKIVTVVVLEDEVGRFNK
jgi:hypothetical protein